LDIKQKSALIKENSSKNVLNKPSEDYFVIQSSIPLSQTPIWESNSQNKLYLFFHDYHALIYSVPKRNLGRRNFQPSEDYFVIQSSIPLSQTSILESNSQNKLYLFFHNYHALIYSVPKRNLGRRNFQASEDWFKQIIKTPYFLFPLVLVPFSSCTSSRTYLPNCLSCCISLRSRTPAALLPLP